MSEKIDLTAVTTDPNNKYGPELSVWLQNIIVDLLVKKAEKENKKIDEVFLAINSGSKAAIVFNVDLKFDGMEIPFTDVIKTVQEHFEEEVEKTAANYLPIKMREVADGLNDALVGASKSFSEILKEFNNKVKGINVEDEEHKCGDSCACGGGEGTRH